MNKLPIIAALLLLQGIFLAPSSAQPIPEILVAFGPAPEAEGVAVVSLGPSTETTPGQRVDQQISTALDTASQTVGNVTSKCP